MIRPIFVSAFCFATGLAYAETPRQECLGRLTFDVPEEMEWATFHADYTHRVSKGGGHGFSLKVGAKGDSGWYDFNGVVIRVSDIVERSEFEGAVRYQKGTGELYKKTLLENIETDKRRLAKLPAMGYGPDVLTKLEQKIEELKKQASLAVPIEHDLGIPDASFLGGPDYPAYGYVYRNQRVYFFAMRQAGPQGLEAFKELVSRFRPRELYEVPAGPGFCFPYGFIADDGKTDYSIKNSLRFTNTPNVIFTLVTTSPDNPRGTQPTLGTYNTDYSPGYDGKKWKFTRFIEPSYIGGHLAGLEGWRLEPKPGSGEQERAWFALAHTGGGTRPMVAVQIFTFQKGVDDLTEFTPPPEEVLPLWKALSKTIQVTLDK